MQMYIPINVANNGKPGFPRQVLTIKNVEELRRIRDAWGDLEVPLTEELKALHSAQGYTWMDRVGMGVVIENALKEIDALHDLLETARHEASISKWSK